MKKRATMMLDYLIADYAAENLDGLFVGAHSRVYDRPVVEKWLNVSSDFGWVLFGLGRPHGAAGQLHRSAICFGSAYEPPEILKRIATDREHPTHTTNASARAIAGVFSTTCTGRYTRPLTSAANMRWVPTRAARCNPYRNTPGMSPGTSPTRGECRIPCSLCILIRPCASYRLTSPSHPIRDCPT